MHESPLVWKSEQSEEAEIQRNQYAIAVYLQEHQELQIVSENYSRDEKEPREEFWKQLSRETSDILRKTFPNGLPKDFLAMSEAQKSALVGLKAELFAYMFGFSKEIYSFVGDEGEAEKFEKQYNEDRRRFGDDKLTNAMAMLFVPEVHKHSFDDREAAAVRKVMDLCAAGNGRSKTIGLVFGGMHDFEKYFKNNPEVQFERLQRVGTFELFLEEPSARIARIRDELIEHWGGKKGCAVNAQKALDMVRAGSITFEEKKKFLRWFLILQGALGVPRNSFTFGSTALTNNKLSELVRIYLDR
jgi:hypothetical protein